MKKSLIVIAREYHPLLMELPNLVDALCHKDPNAPEHFKIWLKQIESVLQQQNHPKVAEIAAIRSNLLSKTLHDSSRKALQQYCASAISEAQGVLQALYDKVNEPIEDAKKILAPMLEAIAQSGAIRCDDLKEFQHFVEEIEKLLNQHEQLRANMVAVNALLNRQDRLWLIADLIDLENWPAAKRLAS